MDLLSWDKSAGLFKVQCDVWTQLQTEFYVDTCRGFIKGRAPGKLTGCEHDFARLLYSSKNFFLIQGTIKNSFKLQ